MKRPGIIFGCLLLVTVFFYSCEKDIITSDYTLDKLKTAKIRAYFYAELDKTKQGLEYVPDGTKIFISIPNSYFNPSVSGNYIDSAKVKNGIIEVTVPTISTGVIVTLKSQEFSAEQVQSYGSNSAKIFKIFTVSNSQTVSLIQGETKSKEIIYDSEIILNSFNETVTGLYIVKADVDENVAGNEDVPAGTLINLYTSTWAGSAIVGASGKITAIVPKGQSINMRFEATKALIVPPSRKFLYTGTIPQQSVSSPYFTPITLVGIQNEK